MDNRKPEVRTAATLVLVREGLEHEWCSGALNKILETVLIIGYVFIHNDTFLFRWLTAEFHVKDWSDDSEAN